MTNKPIADLELQAIQAAKNQDWTAAINLNLEITEQDDQNVQAFIRLGVAKAQLGKNNEAKKHFEAALAIDKSNLLVKKHLAKLKNKQPINLSQLQNTEDFIEEPGKTRIAELHRLANKDQLMKLTAGSLCTLKPKNRFISVELDGKYIGSLPEDLSARLSKLIGSGNVYSCFLQSVSPTSCSVFLKEVTRSAHNQYISSFPVNKAQGTSISDIYLSDDSMPLPIEDIPFQVVETDADEESKNPDNFPIDEQMEETPEDREAAENDRNDRDRDRDRD